MVKIQVSSRKIMRYFITLIFAFSITYCLFQYFQHLSTRMAPKSEIVVKVVNAKQHLGSEVWIAETNEARDYYQLSASKNYGWEYRDKKEFGYGYNFLVFTGKRSETSLTISTFKVSNVPITFFKNKMGGVIEITAGGKKQLVDLHSDVAAGELVTVMPFKGLASSDYMFKAIIYLMIFLPVMIALLFCETLLQKYKVITVCEQSRVPERIMGIDLVRTFAVFFVPSVHFFLHAGYYNANMAGFKIFGITVLRWLFFNGVPLFLILSGYLKKDKHFNTEHYKKIIQILATYLFVSVVSLIIRSHMGQQVTFSEGVMAVLRFKYAWYVEMYIGLFLIMPIMNLAYNALRTKQNREALIVCMLILTSMCTVTENIISNYWQALYPITYYYIGAYLRDYGIRIRKSANITMLLVALFLEAFGTFGYCFGQQFSWNFLGGYSCSYNALPALITATLIFILFYDVNIKNRVAQIIIKNISTLSLEIYMFSIVFDDLIYPKFMSSTPNIVEVFPYIVVTVPLSILCAWTASNAKKLIFDGAKHCRMAIMKKRIAT